MTLAAALFAARLDPSRPRPHRPATSRHDRERGPRMTRCPCCRQPVRGLTRSGAMWIALPCGDYLTVEQAWPIIVARGDDT